jgi:outer membrane phospholipase A
MRLLPPEAAVRAGSTSSIQIRISGATNTESIARFEASFAAQLKTYHGTRAVTLRRTGPARETAQGPGPGESATIPYLMDVPSGVSGPAELSLVQDPAVRTALLVDGEGGLPAGGGAGAQSVTNDVVQDTDPTIGDQQAKVGLSQYFLKHILPYEPMYLLWGPNDPAAKIQFSMKYRLFTFPEGSAADVLNGLHLGYTQTSLWDTRAESAPFRDSSYRPELLYVKDWSQPEGRIIRHLTLQAGLMHESNGQDGSDSRSLDMLYIRPSVRLGSASDWNLQIAPRIWAYPGTMEENPDMADYRGHGDLRVILTHGDGVMFSANLRAGDDWDHLGTQFDVSYPSNELLPGLNLDLFFHAQYYTGFGESLLDYDRRTDAFRVGISLVR